MAIESSNRSPSPMSFRQSPNPNFANSRNFMEKKENGGVRTSATGSPFSKPSVVAHPSSWCSNSKTTPANSPSELGRRNSFSKVTTPTGFSRDINEHKENKKPNPNLKPIKGTKNFMSPTISAVSKVTPSPRKKALAERNEAVRTSASLSDGKFLFFASAGEDELNSETENCEFQKESHKKEESHVSTCEAKKRVTFDDDVVVLSPEVNFGYDADEPSEFTDLIKPIGFDQNEEKETSFVTSVSSPIAPLDADPCVLPPYDPKTDYLSPYDPKTNYLVPRPQFLRYKPENALYIKNLEDTLSSETSSDNDMESTVDEVESEEVSVQEEKFLGSHSSSSVKLESSEESIQACEDEEEISVESDEEISVESDEECMKKPRFCSIWRLITWLLFGVVAVLLSMIVSRHAPPESVLYKVYQYNHADFSGSLHLMKKWSTTYLPLMISSFRETDYEFTTSEFLNFSALICDANDYFVERGGKVEFLMEKGVLEEESKKMDSDSEEMALLQSGILPEQHVQHIEQTGQVELDYSGKSGGVQFIEQSGVPSYPEIESHPNIEADHEEVEVQTGQVELAYSVKSGEDKFIEQSGIPSYPETESHPNLEAYHEEVEVQSNPQSEEAELLKPQSEEAELLKADDPELEPIAASQQQPIHFIEHIENDIEVVESGEAEVPNFGGQGAIMFLAASLCAVTALSAFAIFSKYKKAGIKSISTQQTELPSKLKKEDSFYGNPSHGSQLEAETCGPSEMNSYSYYNKSEAGYESEAQSKEERKQPRRNHKRESLASSSSEYTRGSVSYGSFTTYSVMPAKYGDEEVVTPVRRSSRINKVQPPLQAARRAL